MERKIILASHGNLAQGIASAMEMVIGKTDDIQCFGLMPGEDPGTILEAVEELVRSQPDTQFLILADILGGSVSNSLSRLSIYRHVSIINGVNLALAIGLYLTDGKLEDKEIQDIISQAREGIGLAAYGGFEQEAEEEII